MNFIDYNDIDGLMSTCIRRDCSQVFDIEISELLAYNAIVNHASYGDLILPFLVSSSHFCRNAQLTLLGNRIKHGLALYVCQVDKRNDVRNKAVESMERAIYEVETHLSNDKQYAHVNDTIEDVYENIIKKSYAIAFCEQKISEKINQPLTKHEINATEISQLSKLQSLSTAPNSIDIDRSHLRVRVALPRFNMLLNLNPQMFRRIFNCLITTHNYYFWPAVLIFAPPPMWIQVTMPKHKINFTSLFYIMYQINSNGTEYQFSEDVEKLYNEFFQRAENLSLKSNATHLYLSSVIRRAHTNVIKLCILVKSLNISVDLLTNTDLAIADNITDNFVQQCSILLLSLDSGCFLIDSLTWKSAIKLHSFLMIQKLILLGFPIRQNDYDFLDTLESFFNSHIE